MSLAFRHPLIRAALHETLARPVRAAWHRDAARALAEAGASVEQVAQQLLQIVDLGAPLPVAGWVLEWLAGAAPTLANQVPQIAVKLLSPAVAHGGGEETLTSHLVTALILVGRLTEGEQLAASALALTTDPDALTHLHDTLARCRLTAGLATEAAIVSDLEQALRTPWLKPQHRARLKATLAWVLSDSGRLEDAERAARQALDSATEAADQWATATALNTLAVIHGMRAETAECLALTEKGLAATADDPTLVDLRLLLLGNKALSLLNEDRLAEAKDTLESARLSCPAVAGSQPRR